MNPNDQSKVKKVTPARRRDERNAPSSTDESWPPEKPAEEVFPEMMDLFQTDAALDVLHSGDSKDEAGTQPAADGEHVAGGGTGLSASLAEGEEGCVADLMQPGEKLSYVEPEQTIKEAATLMMLLGRDVLPVMTSITQAHGVISFQSLAKRMILGKVQGAAVKDFMEPAPVVSPATPLAAVIEQVLASKAVLVQDENGTVIQVVTRDSLVERLGRQAHHRQVFMELRKRLGELLDGRFDEQDMAAVTGSGAGRGGGLQPSALSFGDLIRLLDDEARWKKSGLLVARKQVIESLRLVEALQHRMREQPLTVFEPDQWRSVLQFCQFVRDLTGFCTK